MAGASVYAPVGKASGGILLALGVLQRLSLDVAATYNTTLLDVARTHAACAGRASEFPTRRAQAPAPDTVGLSGRSVTDRNGHFSLVSRRGTSVGTYSSARPSLPPVTRVHALLYFKVAGGRPLLPARGAAHRVNSTAAWSRESLHSSRPRRNRRHRLRHPLRRPGSSPACPSGHRSHTRSSGGHRPA